jgi:predicted unusual protein kinase regulating ubiquinone biosynthesis (AarF/ABC1/UbiB family)
MLSERISISMAKKVPRINRFSQMVRFLRVSRLLLWTLWVIYRERRRVIRAHERGNYDVRPNIEVLVKVLVAFRQTAIKLGVLMIKLGQFLSSRADLLPEQALDVLTALQDEVPPAPFSHVVSVIEEELGKPIDQIFHVLEPEATAAASLGQVHKAILASNGAQVAVKVQRPNIDQLVGMDLSTLKFVIRVITRFVNTSEFIDLMAVYREFKRTVYEEIDYQAEANNAKTFREMFANDPTIFIPRVYEEYTSRRVLVLEWVDGIKINDYAALEAAGIDRLEVANRTVQAYFHQFFEAGFFHADPHPGNIFVKPGPPEIGPVIAFVDFGMVGSLNKTMKKAMKDLFVSFLLRDPHALVNALSRLGFIGEGANMVALERGLALMLEQYYGMTLGEARELEIPDVANEVGNLMYGQPFQIPAQFAFTGRAIGTLVGVATGLAPSFNFVDLATPYARKFLDLDAGGIEEMLRKLPNQALEMGRLLLRLPRAMEQLITRLETGQIEVRLAPDGRGNGRPHRGRRNGHSRGNGTGGNGISWVLLSAVTMAGGIFLLTSAHLMIPGWFLLALCGLSGLRVIARG